MVVVIQALPMLPELLETRLVDIFEPKLSKPGQQRNIFR
jgi:hypothetical protein